MPSDYSNRIPPGQQLVGAGKWPIIGERSPAQTSRAWQLSLTGCVTKPKTWTVSELRNLPQSRITIDIHCVTRWSKLDVEFTGVLLETLLAHCDVSPSGKYVSFGARSDRRHSTSLTLATALTQKTLIALEVDGAPLGTDHGGPIRNIVPGRYFYKSVKWLEEIEILSRDRLGFWEAESGYHNAADPWQEQRYIAPSLDRREAIRLIESRDFSNRDLMGMEAKNRDLSGLRASGAALRNADFSESNLQGADFTGANLSNSHFKQSDLQRANFVDADLEGADLSGADLRGADFTGCSLIGASFFDPAPAMGLRAIFDKKTILPEEVTEPLFPEQLAFVRDALTG